MRSQPGFLKIFFKASEQCRNYVLWVAAGSLPSSELLDLLRQVEGLNEASLEVGPGAGACVSGELLGC